MILLNISHACIFVACVMLLSGCGASAFSHRDTNPVVIDNTNNENYWGGVLESASFSTFSTTASRRMVIVLQKDNKTEICAEPSPDVGEAFASAVANAISVKAPIEGVPIEVANQYARAVTTQISSLILRTQGLQLYRDAMHNLCVDRLNDWAEKVDEGPYSYNALRKHYFDESIKLIKDELTSIKDVGIIKAGENPSIDTVVQSMVEILKVVKPALVSPVGAQ